jgi:hypothetical protein
MTNIIVKNIKLVLLILVFFVKNNYAFSQNTTITQDEKFEKLLSEKRKINSSINVSDRFKIQIFKGGDEDSKNTLIEFKKANPSYDVTIVFSTPEYKVWVGNYKSRIEATRNLEIIKKNYPKAILIKPSS